jgi:FkbM family methyltransferase
MTGTSPPGKRAWPGTARLSQSVWCQKEPRCTKFVFQRVQRHALEVLTAQLGTVSFIQVGANDGISGDFLHPFIASGQWQGILVEPGERARMRLAETYAGLSGLSIASEAIWSESGQRPFYEVEGADELSSFSLETILLHAPKYDDLAGMIRERAVPTLTLDALADRHGLPAPDVIAIDAEGCDDIVLAGFSLEVRRPALLLFEHVHLSGDRSAALRQRILGAGYIEVFDRHDILAIRRDALPDDLITFLVDVVRAAREN